MSLFIRVQNSFWRHRKTFRLRAILGSDDAKWVVPQLWSYASENQTDGDFSSYSAQEIAQAIDYTKDAQTLWSALHQTGFLEDGRIVDWEEHNAYHSTYKERAQKAARARWDKEREEKQEESAEAKFIKEQFEKFYAAYPRKVGKPNAFKAFESKKLYAMMDIVMGALEKQKKCPQWLKDNGQFIPHPATWIRREGWMDQVQETNEPESFI